jgi:hypothetical protein
MDDLARRIMARTDTEPLMMVSNAFILASIVAAKPSEATAAAAAAAAAALQTLRVIAGVSAKPDLDTNENTFLNIVYEKYQQRSGKRVAKIQPATPLGILDQIDSYAQRTVIPAPNSAAETSSLGAAETSSLGAAETSSLGATETSSLGVAETSSLGAAETSSLGAAETSSLGAAPDLMPAVLLAAALAEEAAEATEAAQLAADIDANAVEQAALDKEIAKGAAALEELNKPLADPATDAEVDRVFKQQADENTLIDDMVRLAPYAGKEYYKKILITGLKSITDYNPTVLLAHWNRYGDAEKVPILRFIKDPRQASLVFNRLKTQRGGRYTRRRALK